MIYFVQAVDDGPVKIGFTKCLTDRLSQLRPQFKGDLQVLAVVKGDRTVERAIHERFADCRLEGELFAPTASLLAFIEEYGEVWTGEGEAPIRSLVSLRASPEMEAWLDGLVEHTHRGTRVNVARAALREFAERYADVGPMPKR